MLVIFGCRQIEIITASKELGNENGEWPIHPLWKRLEEI